MTYEVDYYEDGERAKGSLLLPSLSPLECLLFASRYKGITKRSALPQIYALLEFFGLTRNRGKKMRELSLGEQKKVMVAMELIGTPSRLHFKELF